MFIAEREGFEPPEPRSSTVFKTAAIDHSAISPNTMFVVCFLKSSAKVGFYFGIANLGTLFFLILFYNICCCID